MIYSGSSLRVESLDSGFAHLIFDLEGSAVNKFDQSTLEQLRDAVAAIASAKPKGAIFSSAKSSFIVGADITEFTSMFAGSEEQLLHWLKEANAIFSAIEDLDMPTVTLLDGMALGGGMEMAISTDYRIATDNAVLGFPEVKLGILPGFGGTVRAPRLFGADNANQWISSGSQVNASQAFKEGAVDAMVAADHLLAAGENLLEQCVAGKLDYRSVRAVKKAPLPLEPVEMAVAFDSAIGVVAGKAGPHYPAPVAAVKLMKSTAGLSRDEALLAEHQAFSKLARSEVAANLVQMFLNDQYLGGKAKKHMKAAIEVKSAAVLGAGIMGGGIAYQSALKGTPIIMKDVVQQGLDTGMAEARKLLDKQVARGKLDGGKMIDVLTSIHPTLNYNEIDSADIIVEAVVENPEVKKKVLAELEGLVSEDTIITSNTSTISIDELASALKRPEKFCGMHFFNPVPLMPLVEVIRGEHSSDETIATTVAYAKRMGKTPIVVNNCPGFLVNRILFPYFGAFSKLIHDGADFRQIDKAMERFGWPMGPAYLLDVVGIDTAVHCQEVMAAGFERMVLDFDSAIDKLYQQKSFGQKTGSGFYLYEADKRGKPRKLPNPDIDGLIASVQPAKREFSDEEIVQRMMVALCMECARCLEDGIVDSPIEADMGLVLGLGYPPFRGGALRYVDSLGIDKFMALAEQFAEISPIYALPESIKKLAETGGRFYP